MENRKSEKEQLLNLERLRKERKYNEFFVAAEQTITDFPDSFPVRFLYAEVLVETKQPEEAEDVLKDLMFAFPDNINLLLELGKITFKMGKYDEASEFLNKILFLNPFNDRAKELLVKIDKTKNGKTEDEEEGKPLDFITYTQEKTKLKEMIMPEIEDEEELLPKRSDIDTTPFTAATKPEDEFDMLQKPDFDTKKLVFGIPNSVGKTTPPPIPGQQDPLEMDMEFDIPSLDETDLPSPGPPPIPTREEPQAVEADMEFDIPPTPPAVPEDEGIEIEFDIPSVPEGEESEIAENFEIPSPRIASEAEAGIKYDIPGIKDTGGEQIEIEYEIPSEETGPAGAEIIEDTIVEMEAPLIPKMEQGPPISPPEVSAFPSAIEDEFPSLEEEDREEAVSDYEVPPSQFAAEADDDFDIPSPAMESRGDIRIEYEIPGETGEDDVSDEEFELPAPREDVRIEYEIPGDGSGTFEVGEGFEIPSPREDIRIEYEIPGTATGTGEIDEEFEIPASKEEYRENMRFEYEIPSETAAAAAIDDDFELPSPREESRIEYEIPGEEPGIAAAEKKTETSPPPGITRQVAGEQPTHMEPEFKTEESGEQEEDAGARNEEADFMTESAADLYLSQGLLDDALTIYEKLYRVQKNEKYLIKIREISRNRIIQKKVQALTRLLNLIEKKGERRV